MNEAEKIKEALAKKPKERFVGSNFDASVIKEAIESAEVFFQLFNKEIKRTKGKKADS